MIEPSLQAQLIAIVRKVGRIPRDVPINGRDLSWSRTSGSTRSTCSRS